MSNHRGKIQSGPLPKPTLAVLANNSLTAALNLLTDATDPRSLQGLKIRLAICDIESAKRLLVEHEEKCKQAGILRIT